MKLAPKLNLWISLPLSVFCISLNAQAATSTTTTTVATTASTPATTTTVTTTAATPVATSTTAAPKKEEAPAVKFGFVYDFGYNLQAQTQTDEKTGAISRSQGLSQTFKPTIGYGEYSAFASVDYDQDLIDTTGTGFSDPVVGLSKKPWELGKYLKLSPSVAVQLPLKDETRNEVSLIYNLGGSLGLSLNTKALGLDAFSLGWQVSANKNFTNYDTNAKTGLPNKSHSLRNRFTFGYDITDAFSFFNMFDFNSNYSVNGVVTNSFFTLQALGYALNEKVSLSLAHTNGGPFLKSTTYENNLKLYDSTSSTYSIGLEVVL